MSQLRKGLAAATVFSSLLFAQNATQLVNSTASGQGGQYGAMVNPSQPQIGGISAEGRYVAFATNQPLDAGDTNNKPDIYVKDLRTGGVVRVSISSIGALGNDLLAPAGGGGLPSTTASPSISSNGRYVVFQSTFNNLTFGDSNNAFDIFLHDRDADENGIYDETTPGARKTVIVTKTAAGGAAGGGTSALHASNASVSDDGRFVAYQSAFTNLVTGDTNLAQDVFVHSRNLNGGSTLDADNVGNFNTRRMSVKLDGTQAGTSTGSANAPTISGNGRFVTFATSFTDILLPDANGTASDILVRDRDLDGNGIFDEVGVGMQALARVNLKTDASQPGVGEGSSIAVSAQAISENGRFVIMTSFARLVAADVDNNINLYLRDRDGDNDGVFDEGVAGLDSTTWIDAAANAGVLAASISGNGRYIAYRSAASNLVVGDTNGAQDAFVRDTLLGMTRRASITATMVEQEGVTNVGGAGANGLTAVSNNGLVGFRSSASNLSGLGTANFPDIFVNGAYPHTQVATPTPSIGSTLNVSFDAPFHAGAIYLGGAAFDTAPGTLLSDGFVLPMNSDPLLAFTLTTPLPFFVNYSGLLDGAGHATGMFLIPNDPGLVGVTIYTGFVIIDFTVPSLISAMSNAKRVTFFP